MSLLAELKRRKVVHVAVVYGATAFAVLQAADIMLPRMAVPDWGMNLVVALTVLGFPIALVLGWALEVTPDGIRRTEAAPAAQGDESATPALLGKRTLVVAGLLVVLGIGLSAGWLLKPDGPSAPPESVSTSAATTERQSVAVLPSTACPTTRSRAISPTASSRKSSTRWRRCRSCRSRRARRRSSTRTRTCRSTRSPRGWASTIFSRARSGARATRCASPHSSCAHATAFTPGLPRLVGDLRSTRR